MNRSTSVAALGSFQVERSQRLQRDVLEAIDVLASEGTVLTVVGVAARAGVSRTFIYKYEHLLQAINDGQRRSARVRASVRRDEIDAASGLRADLETLHRRIERDRTIISGLRADKRELESQRARLLGAQLDAWELVSREDHAALLQDLERVHGEREQLARVCAELERQVAGLSSDLAASRQAHADDVRAAAAPSANVIPIR